MGPPDLKNARPGGPAVPTSPAVTAAQGRDDADLTRLALAQLRDSGHFSLDATLRRWEWAYINAAQQLTHGNISQAARLLGINRTTLYNRIEVLGRAQGDGPAPEED